MRYTRVVLKLSGEFMSANGNPLDPERFASVCTSIESLVSIGVEVCVVAGGGNIYRGNQHQAWGIDQSEADEIGMVATGVNATMLAAMLRRRGIVAPIVLSNGPCRSIGEPWSQARALEAFSARLTPLVAGGWGCPYVSTDYPAVGFAAELQAEAVLMAKSGTDGVYDSDPALNPNAGLIEELTVEEALANDIGVMDRAALLLARERMIRIHVFAADDPDLPAKIAKGEDVGSVIRP